MDNSLSVLVERLVLGEHRVVGSAGSFWAASGRLEHNPCFNPSDMTGEGQSHCLDPKGSCPGKGDTDPTAKHPALPCSGNTTTRAGLGPAPDCQGVVLWLLPLSAGLPCHTLHTKPGGDQRRVGSRIPLYRLWRTKSPKERGQAGQRGLG